MGESRFSDTPHDMNDSVRDRACVVDKSRDMSERPSRPVDWSRWLARGDLHDTCSDERGRVLPVTAHRPKAPHKVEQRGKTFATAGVH